MTATDIVLPVLGGSRVLVVEPGEDAATSLTALLRLNGFDARTARTGAEAEAGGEDPLAHVEATLTELLDRVKSDDDARQQYVDLLELLGPDDPRTAQYRRELSRRLF